MSVLLLRLTFLIILAGAFGCTRSLSVGALPPTSECVAVFPLEVRYDSNSTTELLSEYLALDLFRKGAKGVIGPLDVAKLFREANDPLPPIIDPYWAKVIGKKLKVDAVIFGSLSRIPMFWEGQQGREETNLNVDVYLLELSSGAVRWTYGKKTVVDSENLIPEMSRLSDEMTDEILSERKNTGSFGKMNCWKEPLHVALAESSVSVKPAPTPVPLTVAQKQISESLRSPAGLVLGANMFEERVQRLTKTAVALLRDVAAVLKAEGAPPAIRIDAHLDATEDIGEDLRLSKLRAESIKTYLVSFGVDGSRILAEGHGGTNPIVPNLNPSSRKKNRRVIITALDKVP